MSAFLAVWAQQAMAALHQHEEVDGIGRHALIETNWSLTALSRVAVF